MILKTIVVVIDPSPESQRRLAYAIEIAHLHKAYLTGLFVAPTTWSANSSQSLSIGKAAISSVMHYYQENNSQLKSELEQYFNQETQAKGIDARFVSVDDRDVEKNIRPVLLYTDLIIASNVQNKYLPKNLSAETVLLATGIPILLVPESWLWGTDQVGHNILLGWNGSRESRRAITDSIPFLQQAEQVFIVEVDPEKKIKKEHILGDEFFGYFARHHINVNVEQVASNGQPVADVLLQFVKQQGVDLIIVGAYSRTRTMEVLFGGVTRSLLKSMTVPLLIAN